MIQTIAVGTQAPEAADGVIAMAVPADVLHFVAFVHIDAAVSIHGLLEASITHALNATSCVDAHPVLAHVVVFALVHVVAESTISRQGIALVADAAVASGNVFADAACQAYLNILGALVDVDAGVTCWRERETGMAFALVGTSHVDTATVSAHAALLALVVINAVCSIRGDVEPCGAHAPKASNGIHALSQGAVPFLHALVYVVACLPIGGFAVTDVAFAVVSRTSVHAGATVAESRSEVTLVGWHVVRRSAEMFIFS